MIYAASPSPPTVPTRRTAALATATLHMGFAQRRRPHTPIATTRRENVIIVTILKTLRAPHSRVTAATPPVLNTPTALRVTQLQMVM